MTAEYTCFSAVHLIFSKIDHILDHKTRLKTQKTLNNFCALSHHNEENTIARKTTKKPYTNTWRLNNTLY
jgi:hypothetical protein